MTASSWKKKRENKQLFGAASAWLILVAVLTVQRRTTILDCCWSDAFSVPPTDVLRRRRRRCWHALSSSPPPPPPHFLSSHTRRTTQEEDARQRSTARRLTAPSTCCRGIFLSVARPSSSKCRQGRSSSSSLFFAASSDTENSDNENDGGDDEKKKEEASQEVSKLQRILTMEFVRIGGPALIQLAAEPLASLVDTAYLGRLGPEVLGGAGVAVSAQYALSKLYNDPLLRTSISLVAAQDGARRRQSSSTKKTKSSTTALGNATTQEEKGDGVVDDAHRSAELSRAVSSALLLAATVGLVQLLIYTIFCQAITIGMGVKPSSPMWHSAVSYLQVRALGTPAATLWLVSNGIFRGLGDTQTPLFYSLCFTALNALLDPLFIFGWGFGWGAAGAAAGTALAQYVALVPLLLALHRKVNIDVIGQFRALGSSLRQYLSAGSLVLVRSLGKVVAYSICARQAALLGSVASAAYNLTFQLGFATTQICEAVAVAVQTLLAREMADTSTHTPQVRSALLRHLINTSVGFGATVATTLSLSTYLRRDWILAGLTTNPAVQTAAAAIFPAVLATQILKGMAYPVRVGKIKNNLLRSTTLWN